MKSKPNASVMRVGSVRVGMAAKDKAADKKQGIKENSKADLSKDAILQKLMSARSKK